MSGRARTRLAALAASGLIVATGAAGSFADSDARPPKADLTVRTGGQDDALRDGVIRARVEVDGPGRVTLRTTVENAEDHLRFASREHLRFKDAGSERVELELTDEGRDDLAGRSTRCEPVKLLLRARVRALAGGRADHEKRRRTLAPDPSLCTGGGGQPEPPVEDEPPGGGGGGGTPPPGGGGTSAMSAGAASADITPPVGTPMFAYTARSNLASPPTSQEDVLQIIADPAPDGNLYAKTFEPSVGIHTRLRASTIVIERDGEKFALVQVDLGGLPYALVQRVLALVEATGIEGENLIISATHTHSGTGPIWPPDNAGYGLLGGDLFDPRVFEITAQGIAESIQGADARLEPARVGVGTTQLRGASSNREFDPFRLNPDVPADEAAAREASIDPKVTAIRVDGTDGTPIGVWSNFAIHQTSYGDENLLLSGDNAATTERVVERTLASESGLPAPAPAPPGEDGAPVLVWTNGAEGDISPRGESTSPDGPGGETLEYSSTSAARADLAGIRVANGIVAAWRDAGTAMSDDIELDARRTFLTFDGTEAEDEFENASRPVGPEVMLGTGIAAEGTCLPVDPGTAHGKKIPIVAGIGLIPQTAAVSVLRVGDLGIASFPFEITKQMGARITNAVTDRASGEFDETILAGLTNGYLSYTATPQEYDACTYEGGFTLFGRHQGPLLRDSALSLVEPLIDGEPAPAGIEPLPVGTGTPNTPPLTQTPDAGDPVAQPAAQLRRYERATFSWIGGDPAVDAARGETFVELQRLVGGEWKAMETDDGPEDITAYDESTGAWTETWQFSECDPLGMYRFRVTGHAVRSLGGDPEPYEVTSDPFELQRTQPLALIDSGVAGSTARVRARYPDPGAGALLALPKRVRTGTATISLAGGGQATAQPDADRLGFEATVPAGATISDVEVTDACGNSTG